MPDHMPPEIRLSCPGDRDAVDALLARSYPALMAADYPPDLLAEALPIIARAQPDLLASGSYFVAEQADRVVAAGGWTRGTRGPDRIGHVRHVATDPACLRRGVGRALMGAVMRDAAGRGITDLHCHSSLTAEPFYRALGFTRVAEVMVRLPGEVLFPSIHMYARLGV
ncbi:GNAT family N-acetyltransferase [Lutimaribacter saemankumensis]|uniref:Acetyltransferase (GNAT) domain-containing protein n=1 Tax=Lutimaribacter saemankumensis TaxID=490829 RepID=A0A1G8PJN7_9RHOB|nr:GNAT family N-acetyltransferase [Lutimaribacter saemankumensis]SDI92751.1 Acetyltransferase (GNAT) domain-containing protein [Lutimaribacter saemankumensis]